VGGWYSTRQESSVVAGGGGGGVCVGRTRGRRDFGGEEKAVPVTGWNPEFNLARVSH